MQPLLETGNRPLSGLAFLLTVEREADKYGADSLALLALATQTGIDGTVSPDGYGFGPWQIELRTPELPALQPITPFDDYAQAWAWTANGIQYAVRRTWYLYAATGVEPLGIEAITLALRGGEDWQLNGSRYEQAYERLAGLGASAVPHLATLAVGAGIKPSAAAADTKGPTQFDYSWGAWGDFKNVFSSELPGFQAEVASVGTLIIGDVS